MFELDWTATGAVASVITALGTAAMAVAIIVTAVYARRTLAAATADSRARTRPVIIAEFRREVLSQGTVLLVLKNLGASVAKDVRVTFDPAPPQDIDALPDDNMARWIYQRYESAIPTWAPSWTLANVIRTGHDAMDPMTVTASYEGPDGTQYSDAYFLDPNHILTETTSNPSKVTDPIKLEQQKVSAIQALVRTIRAH